MVPASWPQCYESKIKSGPKASKMVLVVIGWLLDQHFIKHHVCQLNFKPAVFKPSVHDVQVSPSHFWSTFETTVTL